VQLHLVRGSGGRLRGAAERLAVDSRRLRVTVDAVRLEQTARCHRHRHWWHWRHWWHLRLHVGGGERLGPGQQVVIDAAEQVTL